MSRATILIVDDEKNILTTLSRALRIEDFEVDVAGNGAVALEKIKTRLYDVILLDVQLPDIDGIQVLGKIRESQKEVPVIVMSGHGTIETAVQATRLGAHDFLEKPIGTERLLLSLERTLDFHHLAAENKELKKQTGALDALLGASAPMARLRKEIELAASANAPVLIEGERGTGKELVARAIHMNSKRSKRPLEKLNCAAVPSELIESELFGHESGAFTGATKPRRGKFERAHQGTLFLDEVGDMPGPMQAKLLRVLQEGEIERVGGSELLHVDVRVIAATNKYLPKEVKEERFRADLYDRLNVLPLRVPSLRERKEDVSILASYFLKLACAANGRREKVLTDAAKSSLSQYDYPGNVRELRNLVERLVILVQAEEIGDKEVRSVLPVHNPTEGRGTYTPGRPLREMLDEAEREMIVRALSHHQGHITNTAADLGLERSHLYKKMRALNIRQKSEGEDASE